MVVAIGRHSNCFNSFEAMIFISTYDALSLSLNGLANIHFYILLNNALFHSGMNLNSASSIILCSDEEEDEEAPVE